MVKKLDLLESNYDCGLNGLPREEHSKRKQHNVTRFHIRRVTFSRSRSARGDITHGFRTFEYFDHTGIEVSLFYYLGCSQMVMDGRNPDTICRAQLLPSGQSEPIHLDV